MIRFLVITCQALATLFPPLVGPRPYIDPHQFSTAIPPP